MSKLSTTRRRFVSVFASLALTASMLGFAPAAAYAAEQTVDEPVVFLAEADGDATTATITATGVVPTATVGSVTNLLADIDQYATVEANGTYHLDFAVTGGTKFATVNKHKGELTGVAAGTAKVTVYVVSGVADKDGNTPCGNSSLASVTLNIPVEAAEADEYGFQGNEQTIKVTTGNPAVVSGSNSAGWVNSLGTLTTTNGVLSINYSMSSGIGPSWSDYLTLVADKVTLYDSDGDFVATLGTANMYLAQQGSSKTDLTLVVNAQTLGMTAGNSYQLVFASDYSAGNTNNPPLKTLGCSIAFNFSL